MGTNIRNLYITETIIKQNKGLRIGIDLSLYLHKFFAVYKTSRGEPFSVTYNSKEEYTSHLYGLFNSFKPFSKNNSLYFIIDWNPGLPLKKNTRDKRKEEISKREQRIKEYLTDPRTFELAKREIMKKTTYKINYELLEEIFKEIGWNLIKAEEVDAEKYGANLVSRGLLDYFITTDSDTLLFGSSYVKKIKYLSENKIALDLVSLDKTLLENNIDYETLVKAGIVTGTDYSPGVSGIGPKRALDYIKNNNLEGALENFKEIYEYFTVPFSVSTPQSLVFNEGNYLKWIKILNIVEYKR